MKRKLFTLLMLLVSVFAVVAISNTKDVEAANTNNSNEKWSAIGTINGSSWNKDFPLEYNATTDRYELEIALTVNQEFKIRLNNAWTTSIGYGGKTVDGISTYLSNSGGNFKVKTTGNYILWVKDDNVRNYGDKSYGFGIEKAAEVVYQTIKHFDKDGVEVKNEKVIKNSAYNPHFVEVEGYRLEGWYKDKALTQKMEKGSKVSSDLNLYPKYVEAQDYVIYFKDANNLFGTKVNAYMWSNALSGDNTWPGVAMENVGERGWKITVDASKSFDSIIFNNGSSQTGDLVLNAESGDTYVLSKDGSNYSATVEKTGVYYALQDLINPHYNSGVYTRTTNILIDKKAIEADYGKHFHRPENGANVLLDRTTEFVGNYLYFVETKVAFGTSAEGKLVEFTWDGEYDNSAANGNAIEDAFVTLYDFMNLADGWTLVDGKYVNTSAAAKDAAEAFTAPGWISPDTNYTDYSQVVVYEDAGKLVIELYVDSTNSGIVTSPEVNGHCLFSKAIIG